MMHRNRFFAWCMLLFVSTLPNLGLAQDPGIGTIPDVSERIPPPTPAAARRRLPEFGDDRDSTRKSVFNGTTPASLERRLDQIERDRAQRVRRIRQKLSRLKQLAKSCQSSPNVTAAPAPSKPELSNPEPPPSPDPSKLINSAISQTQVPIPESTKSEPLPPTATASPVQVTSTVDRLALANNLFAQGKIEIAGPIYEKLLGLPQKPSDLVWIQYQLASCYRVQSRVKEATKLYRIVASDKDEYWASRAHWWLDYLSRSQAVFDRRQALDAKFAALRKEIDELRAE